MSLMSVRASSARDARRSAGSGPSARPDWPRCACSSRSASAAALSRSARNDIITRRSGRPNTSRVAQQRRHRAPPAVEQAGPAQQPPHRVAGSPPSPPASSARRDRARRTPPSTSRLPRRTGGSGGSPSGTGRPSSRISSPTRRHSSAQKSSKMSVDGCASSINCCAHASGSVDPSSSAAARQRSLDAGAAQLEQPQRSLGAQRLAHQRRECAPRSSFSPKPYGPPSRSGSSSQRAVLGDRDQRRLHRRVVEALRRHVERLSANSAGFDSRRARESVPAPDARLRAAMPGSRERRDPLAQRRFAFGVEILAHQRLQRVAQVQQRQRRDSTIRSTSMPSSRTMSARIVSISMVRSTSSSSASTSSRSSSALAMLRSALDLRPHRRRVEPAQPVRDLRRRLVGIAQRIEVARQVEIRRQQCLDRPHARPAIFGVCAEVPGAGEVASPCTRSPSIACVSVERSIVQSGPTIACATAASRIDEPRSSVTFGPIVQRSSVQFVLDQHRLDQAHVGAHGRMARRALLQQDAVGLERGLELAAVVPAADLGGQDPAARVDHVLERVGEIVLALVGRRWRARGRCRARARRRR